MGYNIWVIIPIIVVMYGKNHGIITYYIYTYNIYIYLVGGWALPLWKMMEFVNWNKMTFPIWWEGHKPNVPNHQNQYMLISVIPLWNPMLKHQHQGSTHILHMSFPWPPQPGPPLTADSTTARSWRSRCEAWTKEEPRTLVAARTTSRSSWPAEFSHRRKKAQ